MEYYVKKLLHASFLIYCRNLHTTGSAMNKNKNEAIYDERMAPQIRTIITYSNRI
jgi:hypothetical protein